jgi:hypothetical protein
MAFFFLHYYSGAAVHLVNGIQLHRSLRETPVCQGKLRVGQMVGRK